MKKVYLYVIALVCFHAGFSQSMLGFKLGFTVPAMVGSTENAEDYSTDLNLNGGVLISRRLNDYWYLQSEIIYAPQAAAKSGLQSLTDFQHNKLLLQNTSPVYAYYLHRLRFNYLEIPVMIKFTTGEKIKLSFSTGPYLGILLNAKSECKGKSNLYIDKDGYKLYPGLQTTQVSLSNLTTVTNNYERLLAGIQAGIEILVPLKNGNIFIESRTAAGLTNLNKNHSSAQKFYAGSFTLYAGYSFELQKRLHFEKID